MVNGNEDNAIGGWTRLVSNEVFRQLGELDWLHSEIRTASYLAGGAFDAESTDLDRGRLLESLGDISDLLELTIYLGSVDKQPTLVIAFVEPFYISMSSSELEPSSEIDSKECTIYLTSDKQHMVAARAAYFRWIA